MSEYLNNELSDQNQNNKNIHSLKIFLKQSEFIEQLTESIHEQYWRRLYRIIPKDSVQESTALNSTHSKSDQSHLTSESYTPPLLVKSFDPPSLSKSAPSSIWNRQGFTPPPQILSESEREDDTTDLTQVNNDHQVSSDSRTEALHTPKDFDSSKNESMDLGRSFDDQRSELSLEAQKSHKSFIPLAERLMRNSQELNQADDRDEPDSSIPQPLDELYDDLPILGTQIDPMSPSNTSDHSPAPIIPLRLTPPPFDPELHAVVAPAPLQGKTSTPWFKIIIVSVVSLIIGGLIAYSFLSDLASFME